MTTDTKPAAVQRAIVNITHAMAQEGIGKGSTNKEQNYKYRGIDDVLNALSPLYAKESIFIRPNVIDRVVMESRTKSGSPLWKVTVKVEYTVVSAVDGSREVCVTYGEAMDSADKATNKALSAAYKYLAIQLFAIPVEGTPDADANTPELAKLIDTEQALEIERLLADSGTDLSMFLTWISDKAGYPIDGISAIPAGAYQLVTKALKKRTTEGAANG